MKKPIYLLLLASLAIAGCVATREVNIPLTDTDRFGRVPDSVLLSLPELPVEIGKVDYVRLPGGEIAIDSAGNIPFFFDYVDSYRMVQFDPIPTQSPSSTIYPMFVAQVGNKLLVTMLVDYKDIHYNNGSQYSEKVNAFYDMNGKFLKFLGEHVIRYESRMKPLITDIHYSHEARLSVNRFAKEICMTVNSHKSVYFDYDGNYLRTETYELGLNTPYVTPWHLSDNYKYIFNDEPTDEYIHRKKGFLIDEKNRITKKVSMFTDIREISQQICKDVIAQRRESDTIWQITPDKMIARYVYQRENPEKQYDNPFGIRLWLSQPYASLTDHYLISSMQYSTNSRDSVLIHGNATQIYDRQTGRSIFFKTLSESSRYTTLQARTVDWHGCICCELNNGELVLDYLSPSSRYPEPIAVLKKILSYSLDKKTNKNNQYIVNKREEKFIRNLKLDGGPVLFFVKLKKF